jgi:L-alanine-DL-glutamate epimerase-like enolase superfamily enzyme
MKITGITTRVIEIDPRPRYKDGVVPAGRPTTWQFPLLTVHTDEGIDGYSTGFGPHGDGLAIVESLHSIYAPEIIGADPMRSEEIWQRIWRKQRHLYHQRDSLLGVIDVAIWDIKGKALGAPIAALLGQYRDRMPCYATARSEHYTAEEIFNEARSVRDEGYHGYKVQLRDGVEQDIPRLRAAREAVGPEFKLMDDPAAGYDLNQALTVGRVLDELGYYWYEEPIPDHHITGLEQLSRHLSTPLLLGETVRLTELPVYLRGAMSPLIRGDTLLKGGITGLRKAMSAAELFGIGLEIHTTDSPLLDIANLHVGCAASNGEFMEIDHAIFRWGVRDNPMNPDADGFVHLPTGPGLGVALDDDWLDDHTAEVRSTT